MKKSIYLIILLAIVNLHTAPALYALNFIDTIAFAMPTLALDEQSGDSIDYCYRHQLEKLNQLDAQLLSGTIRLAHSGNPDSGPVKEMWHLLGYDKKTIGKLHESESAIYEDSFDLPLNILDRLMTEKPLTLEFMLSERTSYNSEKIQLFQSQLNIEYELKRQDTKLSTPEPATLLLLLGSLLTTLLGGFQRKHQ